ncbi:hypothetical protein CK203_046881 [Vitis vinifera]|uniref:Uncharacterized protein n=1 Tax=Vitis vinifera TaxID=29760 RepID=A0A438HY59_VITVI|nr:hypothetical protein CK203_046881 [Vitis vinifera]
MMEELLGQVKARILDIYKLEFQVETRAQAKRSKEEKQANSGSQESNASNRVRFGAEMRKIWPSEANCSRLCENFAFHKDDWLKLLVSKVWMLCDDLMQSHGNFSHPEVISYELLEGEVFNSKFCINPLEPISMAIERSKPHYDHEKDKFAYLSMRDRIELGKRQVQQSQWGSKYALNEDMSMKAKLASVARRIEEFELRNVILKHNHKPCQLHLSI